MNSHRFSIVTAATAAWALASWLIVSTGTQPPGGSERSTSPATERPEPAPPGAAPGGHDGGAALMPATQTSPRAAAQVARLPARVFGVVAGTPFNDAMSHYEAGRYARAFELFSRLADCGHREAARIAMQMRRFGPQLYDMDFAASEPQIARWLEVVAAATDASADRCTTS